MTSKIKIAIISQSPTHKTGFGQTCKNICDGLSSFKHYEIVCFAIGEFGETFNRNLYNYKIWAIGEENLIKPLSQFLNFEKPDIILINFDIGNSVKWKLLLDGLGNKKPVINHFVSDGLYISDFQVNVLKNMTFNITPTNVVKEYLHAKGLNNVTVSPHGVDKTLYKKLDQFYLKLKVDLTDKFIIGSFGRNTERKQLQKILQALQFLKENGKANDILLYLHCQPIEREDINGWNLYELVKELNIEDLVVFPKKFNQLLGLQITSEATTNFDNLNYVERLNLCDLIVNTSFCGGFELIIAEAQSCGVPILTTNDEGNMKEVAGDEIFLLKAENISYWKTNAKIHLVNHVFLANSIYELKNNPARLKAMSELGKINAKRFEWNNLTAEINNCILNI